MGSGLSGGTDEGCLIGYGIENGPWKPLASKAGIAERQASTCAKQVSSAVVDPWSSSQETKSLIG